MQSEPDPRFAGVTGMGSLKKLFEPSLLGCMIMGLVSAIAFLVMLGYRTPWIIVPTLMLGLIAWSWWSNHKKAAAVYEGGFAYHDGKRLVQVRWEEIAAVEENTHLGYEGAVELHGILVRTNNGQAIELPNVFDGGFAELAAAIKEKAPARDAR